LPIQIQLLEIEHLKNPKIDFPYCGAGGLRNLILNMFYYALSEIHHNGISICDVLKRQKNAHCNNRETFGTGACIPGTVYGVIFAEIFTLTVAKIGFIYVNSTISGNGYSIAIDTVEIHGLQNISANLKSYAKRF
jgi:hypothetical protein